MARYAAGDVAAFRQLFAMVAPTVRAFFMRSFRDPAVADDLLQTTFLKLHRVRATYRPELPVRPWLFTIAASVRRDELRRRYRLPPHVGEDDWERFELQMQDERRETSGQSDLAETVRAAIDRLPEAQRAIVYLHRYEGLTFDEIAEVLSTTPGAARTRASRAYDALRKDLQAQLPQRQQEAAR
jgi:RNA polymerase sigma-70 factor (ECF subfamily)